MKKYEISRNGDYDKFNIWFSFCRKNEIPYITVTTRTKYAKIDWDHISYSSPDYDNEFSKNKNFFNRQFS